MVVGLTGGGVAALAVVFATLSWDRADQVAGVVSALVGVAGLGAAVWAALAGGSGTGRVRVSRTGAATTTGTGEANTGVVSSAGDGDIGVHRTGPARSDGGSANTGYREP